MWNAGRNEAQPGIEIAGENINNLRNAEDTTLRAESKEGLKSLLMKVKEESEKAVWKLNIQKTKIMASGPITSWQTDGETMEHWQILFSWALKSLQMMTAAMKLKRRLLLGKKAMTNLDSILKSRDTADKGPSSQSFGLSSSHVWMWALDQKEGWAPKNWCFWLVMLEKTPDSPVD